MKIIDAKSMSTKIQYFALINFAIKFRLELQIQSNNQTWILAKIIIGVFVFQ